MICPKCNSENVFTIDTRAYENTTRRRRVCAECYERWSTVEVTVKEYKQMRKIRESVIALFDLEDKTDADN